MTKCHDRIIRLSSWRDRLTLSAEWIHDQYGEEFVVGFLEYMVKFMLVLMEA